MRLQLKAKPKYVPDLAHWMSECEANYARLCKLVPDMSTEHSRFLRVSCAGDTAGRVSIRVLEQFKYTTTVQIIQHDAMGPWLKKPRLMVRLYHDARMAEVVDHESLRQFKGVYQYPNKKMAHQDEKEQLNAYLGEWLRQCLQYGYLDQMPCLEAMP